MYLIGWKLSMWPSLFRITDCIADIDRSENCVYTGATGLYTVFEPVYIRINRNFKAPSMILIKSTLKMFIYLYVRFYLFLKLELLLRFLDSLKNVYVVCLQFNKHNSYWYREQYTIYRLPSANIIFTVPYYDSWAVSISWYFPQYQ